MSGRGKALTSTAAARLIAKGAGVVFLGAASGSVLRYLFQVLAARGLGAEAFGLWTLGFVVFKISAMTAEFGLPPGIVRHVAALRGEGREAEARGVAVSGARLGLASGAAAAILLFVLAGPIARLVFRRPELADALRLFAAAVPLTTLATVLLAAAQGVKTMLPTVVIREGLEPLLRLGLLAAAFAAGLELSGAVLAYVLAAGVAAFFAWQCWRRLLPVGTRPSPESANGHRLLLGFGWPLFFVQALAFTQQWTGALLLGVFRSVAEVGVYGAAVKTSLLCSLSRNAFHSILSPVVAELDSQGRSRALGATYRTVSLWVFSLNVPLVLGMALFARPVLRLFGEDFAHGSVPLVILAAGWALYSAVGPVGETLIMTGRTRLYLANMAGSFAVNLGLSLALVPAHGAAGAAAASAAAMALYSAAAVLQVRFLVGVRPFPRGLWKPAVSGLASAGAVSVARLVPGLAPVFREMPAALAGGAVFVALYAGLMALLGLEDEDRRMLERVKSRFFPQRPPTEDDRP